ncbi:hypothetical protein ACJX0J_028084, partial [Zea mays]
YCTYLVVPNLNCISEFDGTEGVKYIQQSDILDYLKHAELKNKRPPAIPNECSATQYRLEMIMHISIERDLVILAGTSTQTWVNELMKCWRAAATQRILYAYLVRIVCSVKYMMLAATILQIHLFFSDELAPFNLHDHSSVAGTRGQAIGNLIQAARDRSEIEKAAGSILYIYSILLAGGGVLAAVAAAVAPAGGIHSIVVFNLVFFHKLVLVVASEQKEKEKQLAWPTPIVVRNL